MLFTGAPECFTSLLMVHICACPAHFIHSAYWLSHSTVPTPCPARPTLPAPPRTRISDDRQYKKLSKAHRVRINSPVTGESNCFPVMYAFCIFAWLFFNIKNPHCNILKIFLFNFDTTSFIFISIH